MATAISGLGALTTPATDDLIEIVDVSDISMSANGTNKKITFENLLSNWDGWQPANETWTYASADDPTYTFTSPGDLTGKYSVGMKIKCTNNSTVFFGILTKIEYSSPDTIFTVYGGSDYDLADSAITAPYCSTAKSPYGFPMDVRKWSIISEPTNQYLNETAINDTFYNVSDLNITLPIGLWEVSYFAILQAGSTANSSTHITGSATLGTTDNNELTIWTSRVEVNYASSTSYGVTGTVAKSRVVSVESKTALYFNVKQANSAHSTALLRVHNNLCGGIVTAKVAYL